MLLSNVKIWRFRQIFVAFSENFNFKIGKDQTNQMTVFWKFDFHLWVFRKRLVNFKHSVWPPANGTIVQIIRPFSKILIKVNTFSYFKSALNHSKSTCVTQATDIQKGYLTYLVLTHKSHTYAQLCLLFFKYKVFHNIHILFLLKL